MWEVPALACSHSHRNGVNTTALRQQVNIWEDISFVLSFVFTTIVKTYTSTDDACYLHVPFYLENSTPSCVNSFTLGSISLQTQKLHSAATAMSGCWAITTLSVCTWKSHTILAWSFSPITVGVSHFVPVHCASQLTYGVPCTASTLHPACRVVSGDIFTQPTPGVLPGAVPASIDLVLAACSCAAMIKCLCCVFQSSFLQPLVGSGVYHAGVPALHSRSSQGSATWGIHEAHHQVGPTS